MAIATLSHSLLPLISFLLSFSIFALFLLSLLLKTQKTRTTPHAARAPPCQTESLPASPNEEEPPKEEDKKRKKRGRKKRYEPTSSESGDESKEQGSATETGGGEARSGTGTATRKGGAGTGYPLFPFSSVTSSLQRRIKSKYDEILQAANRASALTVAEVLPLSLTDTHTRVLTH